MIPIWPERFPISPADEEPADTAFNAFADAGDLLLDITGATGTIAASSFDAATIVRI
jgi:hypothetical protein